MSAFSHISFAAKSDVGRKRKNNEDSFGTYPSMGVFCVADGMGGGDDGEIASAATVRAIEVFTKKYPFPGQAAYPAADVAAGVQASLNDASAWILERAEDKHLKGCGSTFVGVVLDASRPDSAIALHAGDSRLYRISGRSIQQITKDHSAAELIGAKDESEVNPMFRGMILRAVGVQPTVEVETTPFPVKEGDRILICSDGLYRMVPDRQALAIIRASDTLANAVDALIAAANGAGGSDNITAVLLEVGKFPAPLPTAEMPQAARMGTLKRSGADGMADVKTQATSGDSGVSFDAAASGDTAESSGSPEDGGGSAGTAMTIPEASENDGNEGDTSDTVEKTTEDTEDRKPRVGFGWKRKRLAVFGAAVALAVTCCVMWLQSEDEETTPPVASAAERQTGENAEKEVRSQIAETAEAEKTAETAENDEKAEEQRRTDVLDEFARVCRGNVIPFARAVNGVLGARETDDIGVYVRPLRDGANRSREERLAAAAALTEYVQAIVEKLVVHVEDADGPRDEKIVEFLDSAKAFVGQSPTNSSAQSACVLMIDRIPNWF